MKILIIQPSSVQMQKAISLMDIELKRNRQNSSHNLIVEIWDSKKSQITYADIKKSEADLLVSFDLAGFEQSTLTDGIAYNLLDCKQIHILLKSGMREEKYLEKPLSISMFFYCADSEYYKYLGDKFQGIPYLKAIEGWKKEGEENSIENNAKILCDIVREVMKICRMLP